MGTTKPEPIKKFQYIHVTINRSVKFRESADGMFQYIHVTINHSVKNFLGKKIIRFNTSMLLLI